MSNWLVKSHSSQTPLEEIVNALTHAAGVGLSIAALVILMMFSVMQHSILKIAGCALFGSSLIVMYTASTLYHAARSPDLKRFFKLVDHASIYGLIAGTYTPVVLVVLNGVWGWTLFSIVWGLALMGLVFKIFFIGRFERLSLIIYIAMGWLAVFAAEPLLHYLPRAGLMWLVAGGLFYTGGVAFYVMRRVKFAHSLWHLCVLGGSICHFFLVLLYVIPFPLGN